MTGTDLTFRSATQSDLPRLIDLLKDDAIAAARETTVPDEQTAYADAFEAIAEDPNNDILIVEKQGVVIGCLQITLVPGLGRKGALRLQIETVRVDRAHQNAGVGTALLSHALDIGRDKGAALAQLTTDKQRTDAHRFYERLGFTPSHDGYKMVL